MKLIYDNLYDFKPFYGIDNWNRIVESGKIDAFDDYLENTYPDGISATGLDALLWNDDEMEQVKNFDQSPGRSHYAAQAFTEKGLYMLATILKSKRAVQTTIAIIDTFAMVRQMANTMEALQTELEDEGKQKKLLQRSGEMMADIIGQNLSTKAVETEIELNFALVKIKHKFIRKDK